MFRKLIISAVACASLALGGCATDGGGTQIANNISQAVQQFQATAAKICGYVPQVSVAAQIVGTLAGQGDLVSAITSAASEFCSVVTAKSAAKGSTTLVVRGVHFKRSQVHRAPR